MKGIWLHDYELPEPEEVNRLADLGFNRVYINNTDGITQRENYIEKLNDSFEVYQWILDAIRRNERIEPTMVDVDGYILDGVRAEKRFGSERVKEKINNKIDKLKDANPDADIEVSTKAGLSMLPQSLFNYWHKLSWDFDYSKTFDKVDRICPMTYTNTQMLSDPAAAQKKIEALSGKKVYPVLAAFEGQKKDRLEKEISELDNYSLYYYGQWFDENY